MQILKIICAKIHIQMFIHKHKKKPAGHEKPKPRAQKGKVQE